MPEQPLNLQKVPGNPSPGQQVVGVDQLLQIIGQKETELHFCKERSQQLMTALTQQMGEIAQLKEKLEKLEPKEEEKDPTGPELEEPSEGLPDAGVPSG